MEQVRGAVVLAVVLAVTTLSATPSALAADQPVGQPVGQPSTEPTTELADVVAPPAARAPRAALTASRPAGATNASCVRGTWSTDPGIRSMPAERYATEHFSFRWDDERVQRTAVEAAGRELETIWRQYMDPDGIDFPEPFCTSTTKRRANVVLHPDWGLSGGVSAEGAMGMWVNSNAHRDRHGLAHELVHALQGSTGGLRDSPYVGWMWESHANWMANQLPELRGSIGCGELWMNAPHLRYGSTRNNYCNWMFWEHLKNTHGFDAVNDIWVNAPEPGDPSQATADPFSVLRSNLGWSTARLNDEFGRWAMRNITWDYTDLDGTSRSRAFQEAFGPYDRRWYDQHLRVTSLDPVAGRPGRFQVPFQLAPQQGGYNVVRLLPEAGRSSISVRFAGAVQQAPATTSLPGYPEEPETVPQPASGWRWGAVSVGSDGRPRYGDLQSSASGEIQVPVRAGDRGHYLVVVGAPTAWAKVKHLQPWYSVYRYPWSVDLVGATPQEPDRPAGAPHPNGGGWVASDATVAASAYVGPRARVFHGTVRGNARIEDRATVYGGTIEGNARVIGVSAIYNGATISGSAVVDTAFRGPGSYNGSPTITGTAYVGGDLELWSGRLERGSYYGLTHDWHRDDAAIARQVGPVREVTARPSASAPAPDPVPSPVAAFTVRTGGGAAVGTVRLASTSIDDDSSLARAFLWQRADGRGGWSGLTGATRSSLQLPASVAGADVRVQVTATRGTQRRVETSAAVRVLPGEHAASDARLVGRARPGSRVTATYRDDRRPAGLDVTYRWTVGGRSVGGDSATLVLRRGTAGKAIVCRIRLSAPGHRDQELRTPARAVRR